MQKVIHRNETSAIMTTWDERYLTSMCRTFTYIEIYLLVGRPHPTKWKKMSSGWVIYVLVYAQRDEAIIKVDFILC